MRMSASMIGLGLTALVLTGCASTPANYAQLHADAGDYVGKATRSEALNVAVATGLTKCKGDQCTPLRDVQRSKLPESLQAMSNVQIMESLSDAWTLGYGVGQFAGVATALPGLSNFSSGMFLVSSFLVAPTTLDHPASKETMIAWMPKSLADTPSQAREALIGMVRESFPRHFDGYSASDNSASDELVRINMHGKPECERPYICELVIAFNKPWSVGKSPSWLGGGGAYAWTNWRIGQMSDGDFHSINVSFARVSEETGEVAWPDGLNVRTYLADLSASLPEWVYIYLPPTEAQEYPVMLNEGKPLLFIEPLHHSAAVEG